MRGLTHVGSRCFQSRDVTVPNKVLYYTMHAAVTTFFEPIEVSLNQPNVTLGLWRTTAYDDQVMRKV